jgi:Tol biopolymer transport system component
MNPDGTGEVQLTDSSGCAHPSWSPGGDRLTFERNGNICLIDLSTREITQLTTSGDCYQPAWRPGTDEIWYVRLPDRWHCCISPDAAESPGAADPRRRRVAP